MDAITRARTFFDTNILVYAFDESAAVKQERAQDVLSRTPLDSMVVSAQVLGEFYWTVTRKLPIPLTTTEAGAAVAWLSSFSVVPVDRNLVQGAIDLGETAGIAYWDALIVKAASSYGCTRLLSEDLSHGQTIDGVVVENPFLALEP